MTTPTPTAASVPLHKSLWSVYTSQAWHLARFGVEAVTDSSGVTRNFDTWRFLGRGTPWRRDGYCPPFAAHRSVVLDPADDDVMAEFAAAVASHLATPVQNLNETLRIAVLRMARNAVPQITALQIGPRRRVFDALGQEWAQRSSDFLWVCLDSPGSAPRNLDDLVDSCGPVSPTRRDRPLGYVGQRWFDMAAIETAEGSGVFEYAYWNPVDERWIALADDHAIDDPYRRGRPLLVVNPGRGSQISDLAALVDDPAVTLTLLSDALADMFADPA